MPTLGATLEQKNEVLELTKLEYHKKWYFPIYFWNSVSGPNISNINANGPFCPLSPYIFVEFLNNKCYGLMADKSYYQIMENKLEAHKYALKIWHFNQERRNFML